MKNGKGSADRLTIVAPAGGVVSGQLYVIGSMAVMAEGDAPEGNLFSAVSRYEFRYAKVNGTAVAQGAAAYFDEANDVLTPNSASGLVPVGYFTAPAADTDTECTFVLTGELTAPIA